MNRSTPQFQSSTEAPATRDLVSWVEINAAAYAGNLRFVRQRIGPGVELAAVVKSNAYGHDLLTFAGLAAKSGADSFCVYSLDEALSLRHAGFRRDVLVLGYVPPSRFGEVIAADLRLALFDADALPALARAANEVGGCCRLHLKVETGTHRHGIDEDRLSVVATEVKASKGLEIEGVYTHFANIEDTTDRTYARGQLARFERALGVLGAAGVTPSRRHTACSAALLTVPETRFDLVRLGIAQYGFWPSKETLLSYRTLRANGGDGATALPDDTELRPVLSWKTRIAQLRAVPAGSAVGYGGTYETTRATQLAVLPVGYGDGYDRRLSNQAHVLVRGHRAPVRGRVCMNVTLVDVTDVPGVEAGAEVVLIGRQGAQTVAAEQLAAWIGTIHYEVVTRIAPHLPRLVV